MSTLTVVTAMGSMFKSEVILVLRKWVLYRLVSLELEEGEYVVCWRAGTEQLADPLTKARANKEGLRDVLVSGNCE